MATIEQGADCTILFARNGANRPLHQDRQILRAGDLALEQTTQDQMLARARRYLHGWGVVAGFIPQVDEGGQLTVGPGYGVTPLGDELFLPELVELPEVAQTATLCCGAGPIGCDQIDPEVLAAARARASEGAVTAWLIARPASREASLRSGVPEGCGHPASTLLPSRRCGGVEFAILCTLPPSHQPQTPECETLMPFVCGQGRQNTTTALPWESLPGPEANFLVIAHLTVSYYGISASVGFRRTLWPVSLIQDWIASCLCPLLGRDAAPPTSVPGGRGEVITEGTIGIRPAPGPSVTGGPEIIAVERAEAPLSLAVGPSGDPVPLPPDEVVKLRDRLDGDVTQIAGIGAARAAALADIGVSTEGHFVTAPSSQLAAALNLPEAKVLEMKQDLNARHDLGLAFH